MNGGAPVLCVVAYLSTFAGAAVAQDTAASGQGEQRVMDREAPPDPSAEDDSLESEEPGTIQNRFARKVGTLSLHALATTTFRGDFWHQVGFGGALAFYPIEELGIEVRAMGHASWLNDAGHQIRDETGLIPDTRRRLGTYLVGGRLSMGYGKIQIADALLVHFDPQVLLSVGVSNADEGRVLPTGQAGLGLLIHFDLGFQLQIDLLAVLDAEDRADRGLIWSVGFAPYLSFGWRLDPGEL